MTQSFHFWVSSTQEEGKHKDINVPNITMQDSANQKQSKCPSAVELIKHRISIQQSKGANY